MFTLNVLEKLNPISDLILSHNVIDENKEVGTIVGTFSTVDPKPGNNFHTYQFVTGNWSIDNSKFKIYFMYLKTTE